MLRLIAGLTITLLLGSCGGDDAGQPYTLCDGSEDVRMSYTLSGGQIDRAIEYTQPYGFDFLYVTGKCEFLTGKSLAGQARIGTLTPAQAADIERRLQLRNAASWSNQDEGCPDAGAARLKTQLGEGNCSCGCDAGAKRSLQDALTAVGDVLDELTKQGAPLSGSVQLVALDYTPIASDQPQAWPLPFDLSTIAQSKSEFVLHANPLQTHDFTGDAAEKLRALRTAGQDGRGVSWDLSTLVSSGEHFYQLYIIDRVDTKLAERIAKFDADGQQP